VCESDTGIKYSTDSTAGSSYDWIVTNGAQASGDTTHEITVDWGSAGNGKVEVVETDSNGNIKDTATLNVTIHPKPNSPLVQGKTDVCKNEKNVLYEVQSTTGSSYEWFITGGSQNSGGNSNSITVDWGNTTSGEVAVQETDSNGCVSDTSSLSITINSIPSKPNISGNDTLCSGAKGKVYTLTSNSNLSYEWFVNNGTIKGSSNGDTITVDW
ncbi:MAG: hypothetical protein ABEH43_01735, partial [Flavobacteriales bacterium]